MDNTDNLNIKLDLLGKAFDTQTMAQINAKIAVGSTDPFLKNELLKYDNITYWCRIDSPTSFPGTDDTQWWPLSEVSGVGTGFGLELTYDGVNSSLSQISAGDLCAIHNTTGDLYVRGQHSDRLFLPDGIAIANIAAGASGRVLRFGQTDVIDVSSYSNGDTLYYTTSDGSTSTTEGYRYAQVVETASSFPELNRVLVDFYGLSYKVT